MVMVIGGGIVYSIYYREDMRLTIFFYDWHWIENWFTILFTTTKLRTFVMEINRMAKSKYDFFQKEI